MIAWEKRKFDSFNTITRGLTYKPESVRESGVRVLRSSNIVDGTVVPDNNDVFVNKENVNIDFAQQNSILVTAANGSPRLVGKHGLIGDINDSVPGGFMMMIKSNFPFFTNELMNTDWYTKFISKNVLGGNGSIGNLKPRNFNEELVDIPKDDEEIENIGNLLINVSRLITVNQRNSICIVVCFLVGLRHTDTQNPGLLVFIYIL